MLGLVVYAAMYVVVFHGSVICGTVFCHLVPIAVCRVVSVVFIVVASSADSLAAYSWGLSQFQAPSPAAPNGDCAQGPEKLGMYLARGVDQST